MISHQDLCNLYFVLKTNGKFKFGIAFFFQVIILLFNLTHSRKSKNKYSVLLLITKVKGLYYHNNV